jgi:hypothetical protein
VTYLVEVWRATRTAPSGKFFRSSSRRTRNTGPAPTPRQATVPWSMSTT